MIDIKNKVSLFLANISLFLALGTLSTCSDEGASVSINQLLTNRSQKAWLLTSRLYNGLENIEYCETDNVWIFKQGNNLSGELNIDKGFLRCSLPEQDDELNWFLGAFNQNIIYINLTPERAASIDEDVTRKGIIREIREDYLEIEIQVLQNDYATWTDVIVYKFEPSI